MKPDCTLMAEQRGAERRGGRKRGGRMKMEDEGARYKRKIMKKLRGGRCE